MVEQSSVCCETYILYPSAGCSAARLASCSCAWETAEHGPRACFPASRMATCTESLTPGFVLARMTIVSIRRMNL